jgi:hypothetical protein
VLSDRQFIAKKLVPVLYRAPYQLSQHATFSSLMKGAIFQSIEDIQKAQQLLKGLSQNYFQSCLKA